MALKNCRECGKKVSTEAASCPSCGAPNSTLKKTVKIDVEIFMKTLKDKKLYIFGVAGLIVIIIIYLFFFNIGKRNEHYKCKYADGRGGFSIWIKNKKMTVYDGSIELKITKETRSEIIARRYRSLFFLNAATDKLEEHIRVGSRIYKFKKDTNILKIYADTYHLNPFILSCKRLN